MGFFHHAVEAQFGLIMNSDILQSWAVILDLI